MVPLVSTESFPELFGLKVWPFHYPELLQVIDQAVAERKKLLLFPLNSQAIHFLHQSSEYHQAMKQADIIYADGSSTVLASKILGRPIAGRMPTTDLIVALMEYLSHQNKKHRLFFLGAAENVVKKALAYFRARYPQVNLVGYYSPPFLPLEEMRQKEDSRIAKIINSLDVDILFVAFGIPKQEIWCCQNKDYLRVSVFIPCGGLFSYYSGQTKRAPRWVQFLGLEWCFRLLQEPQRLWKRYLVSNSLYIWYVLKERLKSPK